MTQLTAKQLDLVKLECQHCHVTVVPTLMRGTTGSLGAYCPLCNGWIKWVPQNEVWLMLEYTQSAASTAPSIDRITTDPGAFTFNLDVIRNSLILVAQECWRISDQHGWHETPRSTLERAMLVVTECAELSEAARNGTLQDPDDHIPAHTQAAAEWADMLVRVFDHSPDDGVLSEALVDALLAKIEYNRSRPYRHGNKTI